MTTGAEVLRAGALSADIRKKAEKNRGTFLLRQSIKNTINARFKRCETLQMFSGVLSCTNTKTQAKRRYIT